MCGGSPERMASVTKILRKSWDATAAAGPEEAIQAHLAFLARRRSLRPGEEYRVPTDAEWAEFLGHFELRKVATGGCGRAFGTPCVHEHSCLTEMILESVHVTHSLRGDP
jgi:hypothetical protein